MSKIFNYKSFFCESPEEGYWGQAAAGCIFIAKDTGRILLAHRSDSVDQPDTWGTWGGKIDGDESPKDAIQREVEEETGIEEFFKIHPLWVYKDGNFKYYNFLVITQFEFTPRLNWENDDFGWVEFGQWPRPLHFGLRELIKHDGDKIKQIVGVILADKEE